MINIELTLDEASTVASILTEHQKTLFDYVNNSSDSVLKDVYKVKLDTISSVLDKLFS